MAVVLSKIFHWAEKHVLFQIFNCWMYTYKHLLDVYLHAFVGCILTCTSCCHRFDNYTGACNKMYEKVIWYSIVYFAHFIKHYIVLVIFVLQKVMEWMHMYKSVFRNFFLL